MLNTIITMNILLLDTSTAYCAVAAVSNNQIHTLLEHIPRQHNQFLIDCVDRTLNESGLTLDDIDLFAYGVGPGSFVGVRLASAFMHGLSIAKGKPLLGFSSMEAIAYHQAMMAKQSQVSVLLDAKMGDVYYGVYDFSQNKSNSEESLIAYTDLASLSPQGWIVSDVADMTGHHRDMCPNLEGYAQLFQQRINANPAMLSERNAQPVYLQGTKNWKKKGE